MTARLREFLDTNVVVYAFTDDPRCEAALALLSKGCVVSVQVLNEFANVARSKLDMSWSETGEALDAIRGLCPAVLPMDVDTHSYAIELAERYGFSVFDALVVAAALRGGCAMLWSEDMHDGLVIEGRLKVLNPFRD